MTIDTAKELQMNIAKEGLALLVLHPTADVQLHRECISHIGTAWDIPSTAYRGCVETAFEAFELVKEAQQ